MCRICLVAGGGLAVDEVRRRERRRRAERREGGRLTTRVTLWDQMGAWVGEWIGGPESMLNESAVAPSRLRG